MLLNVSQLKMFCYIHTRTTLANTADQKATDLCFFIHLFVCFGGGGRWWQSLLALLGIWAWSPESFLSWVALCFVLSKYPIFWEMKTSSQARYVSKIKLLKFGWPKSKGGGIGQLSWSIKFQKEWDIVWLWPDSLTQEKFYPFLSMYMKSYVDPSQLRKCLLYGELWRQTMRQKTTHLSSSGGSTHENSNGRAISQRSNVWVGIMNRNLTGGKSVECGM